MYDSLRRVSTQSAWVGGATGVDRGVDRMRRSVEMLEIKNVPPASLVYERLFGMVRRLQDLSGPRPPRIWSPRRVNTRVLNCCNGVVLTASRQDSLC